MISTSSLRIGILPTVTSEFLGGPSECSSGCRKPLLQKYKMSKQMDVCDRKSQSLWRLLSRPVEHALLKARVPESDIKKFVC